MRTAGHRWTMRSMIGISIAERAMNTMRMVCVGR